MVNRRKKRNVLRVHRRFKVHFSSQCGSFNHTGFSENISPTGLCISSNHLCEVGQQIWLKVFLDHETYEVVQSVVTWRRKAPAEFQMAVRHGMGIRITQASEKWYWLFYEMSSDYSPPLAVKPAIQR